MTKWPGGAAVIQYQKYCSTRIQSLSPTTPQGLLEMKTETTRKTLSQLTVHLLSNEVSQYRTGFGGRRWGAHLLRARTALQDRRCPHDACATRYKPGRIYAESYHQGKPCQTTAAVPNPGRLPVWLLQISWSSVSAKLNVKRPWRAWSRLMAHQMQSTRAVPLGHSNVQLVIGELLYRALRIRASHIDARLGHIALVLQLTFPS